MLKIKLGFQYHLIFGKAVETSGYRALPLIYRTKSFVSVAPYIRAVGCNKSNLQKQLFLAVAYHSFEVGGRGYMASCQDMLSYLYNQYRISTLLRNASLPFFLPSDYNLAHPQLSISCWVIAKPLFSKQQNGQPSQKPNRLHDCLESAFTYLFDSVKL